MGFLQDVWDWLVGVWGVLISMSVYDWQTVFATGTMISSVVFVGLYSLVSWWKSDTGWNLMTMAASIALLASGSVTRRLVDVEAGHTILLFGWFLVLIVMNWRIVQMWRTTHPRNAPTPATPVSPTTHDPEDSDLTGRQWYTPTPSSVIEKPRRKDR